MRTTRREILLSSGALAVTGLLGCRASETSWSAPAMVAIAQRRVLQTLPGVASVDGAGVHLTRVIGQQALRHLDPFLLLDRIHSDDPAAYVRGFPDHPHRGFETVTVMLDGAMRHKDSRGNHGLITRGGAQWMTAGRGIVHSEMPEQEQGMLEGFQLWMNLPAREKMCDPHYQDLQPQALADASLSASGSRVRVISGHANGLAGPVRERPTDPTLLTLALADDTPFELEVPDDHAVFAFVYGGSVMIGPDDSATRASDGTLAILGPGNRLRVRAREEASGVLLAAARPLHEPIVQRGPFVMNTEAEIQRAIADYQAGVLDRELSPLVDDAAPPVSNGSHAARKRVACAPAMPSPHSLRPTIFVVALTLSCAGPQMSGRQTRAAIARSDDPWLVGDRCTPDTPTEPAPRVEILAEGIGEPVTAGATVRVHYVATLANGAPLHDSHDGNIPSEIILGSTKLICGFERGLVGMRAGEQRRVFVPSALAFGEEGRPPEIGPNADLVFVIDLYLPADVVTSHGSRPTNPGGAGGGGRRR